MTRIVSAVVLGALVFGAMWLLPPWVALVLGAIAAAQAGVEVAGLAAAAGARVPSGLLALLAAAIATAFALHGTAAAAGLGEMLAPALLVLVVGVGLVSLASGPPAPSSFAAAAVMGMGPIYVGVPIGALMWIAIAEGPAAFTGLIAVVAASDTAQYYSGRAFGRRKLAPAVSPAKTVEGAIGGVIAASLVAALIAPWWITGAGRATTALLGLALAGFGMAGDLFESLLKRSAGVKDSSSIIPGHGGVLDRLDSYLFAAPCFYFFLNYFPR